MLKLDFDKGAFYIKADLVFQFCANSNNLWVSQKIKDQLKHSNSGKSFRQFAFNPILFSDMLMISF